MTIAVIISLIVLLPSSLAFTGANHPGRGIRRQTQLIFGTTGTSSSFLKSTEDTASSSSSSSTHSANNIDADDIRHMNHALECAKKGLGYTYPNPAVGCVLVRQDTNQILGTGFHPRAGYPHAEVFALFQAMGHVSDGVAAAESVIQAYKTNRGGKDDNNDESLLLFETVKRLTDQYASSEQHDGPEQLFSTNTFDNVPVTAYVTLEPCCHYGKTPPCAASLVQAKVARVVVGFRDPNPRVDGGGLRLLQSANIQVDVLTAAEEEGNNHDEAVHKVHKECADIVSDFVKRITPRPQDQQDYAYINGAMRRGLRSHVGRMKASSSLVEVVWTGASLMESLDDDTGDEQNQPPDFERHIQDLTLDPSWLEKVDHLLWQQELILLRLSKAVKKKKAVKLLGERIADQLQAHVAQTIGHTVLLYRPGIPPVLDLASLIQDTKTE